MFIRCVLMLSLAVSMPALADRAPPPDMVKRTAMVDTLARGKSVTVLGQTYQLLPEVFATMRTGNDTEKALSQVGASSDAVIETKGNFVLFRSTAQRTVPYVSRASASSAMHPTVINTRTKTIGILMGTIIVKPKQMRDVSAIAATHGLEVVREFAHLRAVVFKVRDNADIFTISAALAADGRVETAYPEIFEHAQVPN